MDGARRRRGARKLARWLAVLHLQRATGQGEQASQRERCGRRELAADGACGAVPAVRAVACFHLSPVSRSPACRGAPTQANAALAPPIDRAQAVRAPSAFTPAFGAGTIALVNDRIALLEAVARLAAAAGREILTLARGPLDVQRKADDSPVTEADRRAEVVIAAGLACLAAPWPVVAEEACSRGEMPPVAERFWLVDPLDGTREFAEGSGEYTVNIALVEQGLPTLGVVLAPALDRCYLGLAGQGAWCEGAGQARRRIQARAVPASGPVAALSRRHGDAGRTAAWLARHEVHERVVAGSSLKFGLLAAGEADLYPRLGRTMEWDTAAGQAVLVAAGGSVCDLAGRTLRYGKPGYENPDFVARGAAAQPARPPS
ncbi:MAG: 3'(2'),5'-bisphosphate nucleotidase CysQ [Rubrivivax sp.]|nr:3'(2'),5'-bisphosphate nucleotidase CysQ [Rubrivivax sp.]